jgi:hypothetical protein
MCASPAAARCCPQYVAGMQTASNLARDASSSTHVRRFRASATAEPQHPAAHRAASCACVPPDRIGGALLDPEHRDMGSTVTLSCLLSDPSTFEGGTFLTWESGRAVCHDDLAIGDAVVFHSERAPPPPLKCAWPRRSDAHGFAPTTIAARPERGGPDSSAVHAVCVRWLC